MGIAIKSYNPGFLTDVELRESFCVRVGEFESLVETLRENTGTSNQHVMVVGARGSGKTTLLLRAALEIRSEPALSSRLYAIVFAEESYGVGTCGEFWLECLSLLARQVPHRHGGFDLRRTLEDARRERDDRSLRERCLGALLQFADREGKRLVLGVENLDMMFSDMVDPQAGWCLRKTLQTEPRIMMIGSATNRFDEIDRPDRALYDLFRIVSLRPLGLDETAKLCSTVSGRPLDRRAARRLQILTGGNPRLLTILARFGAARSFRALMSDLLDLVDEHTAYFKGHLESLPPQERKVYLALAELWKPATAREVAERARMHTSKCSAQLRRLIGRGAVSPAGGTDRRRQYYVSERLYNTYYLLRRSRGTDNLVGALVEFMDAYYSRSELKEIVDRMAVDVEAADWRTRLVFRAAFDHLSRLPKLAWHLLREYPELVPDEVKTVTEEAGILLVRGLAILRKGDSEGALRAFDDLLRGFGSDETATVQEAVARALFEKSNTLVRLNRFDEVIIATDEAFVRFEATRSPALRGALAGTLINKVACLLKLERAGEGLAACDELIHRFDTDDLPLDPLRLATALLARGQLLGQMTQLDEELDAYDEVERRFGSSESVSVLSTVAHALLAKAARLSLMERSRESIDVCDQIVRRFEAHTSSELLKIVADALLFKSSVLGILGRTEEQLAACEEVLSRILPRLDSLPGGMLEQLMTTSLALGIDRSVSLIKESPSAGRLLALTTALELQMGMQPRVAVEVREVADDILRDLAWLQENCGDPDQWARWRATPLARRANGTT